MQCPACGREVPESSRFCPACGARVDTSQTATRTAADPPLSSHALDGAQFIPGTMLADRYASSSMLVTLMPITIDSSVPYASSSWLVVATQERHSSGRCLQADY
jgi:zinc-ribbon domain